MYRFIFILSRRVRRLNFLSFLALKFEFRLAKLPVLFGFGERKSFFPHDFDCDLDYNGPWPSERYFPTLKTDKDRTEFRQWLIEQKKIFPIFNYLKQMEIYCLQVNLILSNIFFNPPSLGCYSLTRGSGRISFVGSRVRPVRAF